MLLLQLVEVKQLYSSTDLSHGGVGPVDSIVAEGPVLHRMGRAQFFIVSMQPPCLSGYVCLEHVRQTKFFCLHVV